MKRIIAMLMTVILLAGTAVNAVGPEAGDENTANLPEIPEVTIVGNDVNGAGKFLEVSLRVSGWRFQSAGVVLSYDTAVLTPVDWTEEAGPIDVRTDWTTVVPTKGTDYLSGKPALATIEGQGDVTTIPGTNAQEGDGEGAETPESPPAAPPRAYLYLGADALQGLALEEERIVTARFAITEGKTVTLPEPGHETEETNTLCLATNAAILDTSVPGMPLMTTTLDERGLPADHLYQDVLSENEDGTETLYTVRFEADNGPSVNTGGPVGGGDYAITFFDWDGRVIDAISAGENALSAVTQWQALPTIREWLGNKPGYEFETWIVVRQVDEKLISAHSDLTSRKSSGALTPVDAADFTDLSKYAADPSKSVLVQATYKTTSAVNSGKGDDGNLNDDTARYQFGTPSFYQYGPSADANNGQYAVRVPVTRGDVLRADEPVVYAVVTTPGGAVIEKVTLENTDVTQFEVVVPKITTSVTYMVLDAYGETAWTLGLQRSQEGRQVKATILKEGAFALLVDEGWLYRNNDWDLVKTPVNDVCFRDAGYSKVNAANLRNAMKALSDASDKNGGVLTRAQADSALAAYR